MKALKASKRKTKTTFKVYAAWDFEFEAEEYNRMSAQGWQLVEGGGFHQKYAFDDSVVYRYQIDFNNKIDNMARYEETFRDAGWERVNSTFNDWHIFRKVYDPALPDEEYEIYTDEQSRGEMLRRWRNLCFVCFGVTLMNVGNSLRILDTSDAGFIGVGLLMATGMMFGMLIAGLLNINRQLRGQKNTRPYPIRLFLLMLFLLLVFLVVSATVFLIQEGSYAALEVMVGIIVGSVVVVIAALFAKKIKK